MRYPKGPNEGKLISPYLQKKTYNYMVQSLYKSKSDYCSLQDSNSRLEKKNKKLSQKNQELLKRTQSLGAKAQHSRDQKSKHIAEIRSLVRRSRQITNEEFRKKVKKIFNPNKNFYSSNTIWLATNVLQVGQMSLHSTVECMRLVYEFLVGEPPRDWLSTSTLRTWHQDVSELQFKEQINQIRNALTFGIMIDESTRGQIKNLVLCYQYWNENDQLPSVIVAQLQHVIKCNANTISDVVIKHIQECNLEVKKCTIWTTDNTSYMSGDKKGAVVLFNKKTNGNSLRIDLYDGLLGYHYNQYQLPLRTRWGYELRTAKQFIDRRTAHVEFANWFVSELKNHNTSKQYFNDWCLFQSWLLNSKLNIQIKCLINFAEHFYEPLTQFMTGQGKTPRIYQNNQFINLPPGRRAHEMPDKVYEWYRFFQEVAKNFEMFFADELLEALETLSSEEFGVFFEDLEKGINKALNHFEKWFAPWLHLSLVVCRLGGNNARSFASSFYCVVLKKPWAKSPDDLELRFAEELEDDLRNGKTDSLGLYELLLQDNDFFHEFEEFCVNDELPIYNFPRLYHFIKNRIYFIVIHQQQVEGLFNKLDLKTHPNMSLSVKQSKLRLSSSKIDTLKKTYRDPTAKRQWAKI
ncbi:hypothetical protein C2G38_2139166 [Gigaspora rosea]|uniref:Uncharacterized protein n=1 Tax=Gigaspora rosea TaxID=44941 RepID=A0A397VS91_9GLOM|nr:hypothetical protein C2G38_2139166 [Gigaspora rosea]